MGKVKRRKLHRPGQTRGGSSADGTGSPCSSTSASKKPHLLPAALVVIAILIVVLVAIAGRLVDGELSSPLPRSRADRPRPPRSTAGSSSTKSLLAMLDRHLLTPLPARRPVELMTVGALLQGADPDTPESLPDGTRGGLSALGYAMLLHDPALVEYLLKNESASPFALVSWPLTPTASFDDSNADRPRPRPTSAAHESALLDGLRPIHLSILSKDIIVETARAYLAQTHGDHALALALPGEEAATDDTEVSAGLTAGNASVVSTLGAVLRHLSEQQEGANKEQEEAMVVSFQAVREAVDHVVTIPILRAVLDSLWDFGGDSRQPSSSMVLPNDTTTTASSSSSSSSSTNDNTSNTSSSNTSSNTSSNGIIKSSATGARAVTLALGGRDRFSRTSLHLAALSGSTIAVGVLLREWMAAVDLMGYQSSASARNSAPMGVDGCWLLRQPDQLNRTALHYAAIRGDSALYDLLLEHAARVHLEPSAGDDDDDENENENEKERRPASGFCDIRHYRDVNGKTAADLLRSSDPYLHSFTVEQPLADLPENEGTMNDGNIEVGDGDWPSASSPSTSPALPRHRSSCDFDVVNASTISARTFLMRYLAPSQPVLLRGAANEWPLRLQGPQRWDRTNFLERFGSHQAVSSTIPYADRFGRGATNNRTTIADFVAFLESDQMQRQKDEGHGSSRQIFSDRPHPDMLRDFPLIPGWLRLHERLVDPMPAALQYFVGGPNAGAPHHWHGDAWNALAFGLKEWTLLPPARAKFSSKGQLFDVAGPSSHGKESTELKRNVTHRAIGREEKSAQLASLKCTQHSGDVFFVPASWGHSTRNIRTSVGIAVEFRGGDLP